MKDQTPVGVLLEKGLHKLTSLIKMQFPLHHYTQVPILESQIC